MTLRPCTCSVTLALIVAVAGLALRARAADEAPAVNPTGAWKVTFTPKPKSPFEPVLKLKRNGDKLTGTLSQLERGKTNEVALEDAKLTGTQVSFTTHQTMRFYLNGVAQPADHDLVTESKFLGTISDDTIKGKVERHFIGNVRLLEWEAKRVKP
ncbi:MAG: hypothetical protein ABSC03_11385 [Verrucomicrobiota bacterium]|jgi:hypothetical protein